jgi:hypothetical protein
VVSAGSPSRVRDVLEDDAREALREMNAEHPGVIAILSVLDKIRDERINTQRFSEAAAARDLARALREHKMSPHEALKQLQAFEPERSLENGGRAARAK